MNKYYIYKMNILDDPLYFGSYIGQRKIGKKEPMKDGYKGSGSDWKKYILSNHVPVEKEILCMCESVEEANEMEQFYIEQYKNDGIYLWNMCKGGGNHEYDRIYTEEEIKEHRRLYEESRKEQKKEYLRKYNQEHKEDMREQKKEWKHNNKEKVAESAKRYYESHKEQKSQYEKQRREANIEHERERHKRYYGANKEHILECCKQYRQKNKEKYADYQKKYGDRPCLYNGEVVTLRALKKRFHKKGIEHPCLEAKKYLIERED